MSRLMQISAPGQSATGAGFEDPLAMLRQCHRRVEQQCATLTRLVPHLIEHGSDANARDAADAVLRYFGSAAMHHHADEEEDLFPALFEAVAGSDAVCLRGITERLLADHAELASQWAKLRGTLLRVVAGQPAKLDATQVSEFAQKYAGHIAIEEGELLPMAERLLGDDALRRMGAAMRERRAPGT
jgi:hemerythrin-like domain-containing protein